MCLVSMFNQSADQSISFVMNSTVVAVAVIYLIFRRVFSRFLTMATQNKIIHRRMRAVKTVSGSKYQNGKFNRILLFSGKNRDTDAMWAGGDARSLAALARPEAAK